MAESAMKKFAVAMSAIAVILVLVPFEPSFPEGGLEWSWVYAMNIAVARGLQFGRDVIFTYGPLASMATGAYHPATDTITIISRLIFAAAVFMVFLGACDRKHQLWLLALPLVLSQRFGLDPIFMMLPPMFLLFCVRNSFSSTARAVTILLSAAAFGLMPLVKGTFAPAVAICGSAALLILWRQDRRLVLGAVAVFVATLVCGWLASSQNLDGLLNYFIAQQPIISGYSDAMSSNGAIDEVVVFAVVACLLLIALWISKERAPWFVLGSVALIFFLAFKAGFVRHDAHAAVALYGLLFLGFFIALWAPGRFSLAAFMVAAVACVLITSRYTERTSATMASAFTGSIATSIRGLHARVFNPTLFSERLAAANEKIRASMPLPRADGSADIYPIDLAALFASDIHWAPRPVFQSYSAYTPKLAQLNRDHVERSGPDRVFFRMSPVDGRFAPMEDGASWLPLLARYRATGFAGEFAVLDRRTDVSQVTETPIATLGGHLGEPISLQGLEGPIFIRIEVGPTIIGRLLNLAFKPPELRIALTYANGEHADFRYVAGMGATGFLLSPAVTTKEQFVALQSTVREGYFRSSLPVSFKIYEAESPGLAWRSLYAAKLSRLSIPGDEAADALLFAPPTKVASLGALKTTQDCAVDRINGVAPTSTAIPRNGNYLKLSGWGMVSGKDGVQADSFSLALVDSDGSALVYPLKKLARPDVGAHFGHPGVTMVGFEGDLNITPAAGGREVRILQTLGREQYACAQQFRIDGAKP
jgi:hypothetical protein